MQNEGSYTIFRYAKGADMSRPVLKALALPVGIWPEGGPMNVNAV